MAIQRHSACAILRCGSTSPVNYKTVFDADHHGYSTWSFPASGLVFLFIGALLVFKPLFMLKLMPFGLQGRSRTVLSWFFFVFAALWTLGSFAITYIQYQPVEAALRDGHFDVAEGQITDFIPMPYNGHSQESFVVGGHRFSYFDYTVTYGFNNTASHGGPIRTGISIRVSYVGDLILRLEVAQ